MSWYKSSDWRRGLESTFSPGNSDSIAPRRTWTSLNSRRIGRSQETAFFAHPII